MPEKLLTFILVTILSGDVKKYVEKGI